MSNMKAGKIALIILAVLAIYGDQKTLKPKPKVKIGGILEVELRMAEIWKPITIGPTHAKGYHKMPHRFSKFMTVSLHVLSNPIRTSNGTNFT